MVRYRVVEDEGGVRHVRVELDGDAARVDPAHLQYLRGKVSLDEGPKGLLGARREAFPLVRGRGEIVAGPPGFEHFQVLEMRDEAWLLASDALVACDAALEVERLHHDDAVRPGRRPPIRVRGTGRVVLRAPGPTRAVGLHEQELTCFRQAAVACSEGLTRSVRHGAWDPGDGTGPQAAYTFEGTGIVLLAPVPNPGVVRPAAPAVRGGVPSSLELSPLRLAGAVAVFGLGAASVVAMTGRALAGALGW